jgi:hypothetical protein
MRSITTGRMARLFSLALLMGALAIVPAQAKTDFSGTWKMNASKCDFGPMPPPDGITEKITHHDPDLKTSVVSTGGPQGDMSYDMTYTTDGKESSNSIAGNDFKSTVTWDGDALAVATKGSIHGTDFTSKDRWTLSEDGKTLTVTQHFSSSMGEADLKMVFDKQDKQ